VRSIAALDQVARQLEQLARGLWDPEYVLVHEVLSTRACTVLISSSRNAHIELKATANVAPAHLRLSSASAKLAIKSEKGMATKLVAEKGMTPLYHVAKVVLDDSTERRAKLVLV